MGALRRAPRFSSPLSFFNRVAFARALLATSVGLLFTFGCLAFAADPSALATRSAALLAPSAFALNFTQVSA